jgi:hypothetical protein
MANLMAGQMLFPMTSTKVQYVETITYLSGVWEYSRLQFHLRVGMIVVNGTL